MSKLTTIIALMLFPFALMAQHEMLLPHQPKNVSAIKSLENLHNKIELPAKLRSIYFLIGSRSDTFITQSSSWSAFDSTQLFYTSDDSGLYELNELVHDPDSGWINSLVKYYAKNEDKLDTSLFIQSWDDELKVWNNESKFTYAYDASYNLISTTIFNWDAGSWQNSAQIVNTFDSSNNLLNTTILNWDVIQWDSVNQFIYSYDSNNNVIGEIDYYYSGGWQEQYKYVSLYDGANLKTQTTQQYKNGTNWKNSWKDTLVYDVTNNLLSLERKDWKQSDQDFILTDSKIEYSYNSENQLILRTDYNGDGASSYTPAISYTYEYDAGGNNTSILQQLYDIGSSSFVNFEQFTYYYTDMLTGITSIPNNAYVVKLFPNPASDLIQLSMSAEHPSDARLEILDADGRLLHKQQLLFSRGDNFIKLNMSEYSRGIYFIRLVNAVNGAQSINRFVKQ